MREFRFVLGRRALIVFLALLVATGALLGAPAVTRTLAVPADGWRDLNPFTPSPAASQNVAMAATPSGDVVLFGNFGGAYGETWIFNTATNTWGQVITSSTPSVRSGHAMATLPGIGVLLFGGEDAAKFNDTWLFTYDNITKTGAWTETNTAKEPTTTPTKRYYHAMAIILAGVLLFGGTTNGTTTCSDTWLFDSTASTWNLLTNFTSTPSARYGHAMVTTSSGALLFGGLDGGILNDTWLFVTPTISVTSPTPGATWAVNQPVSIVWTSIGVTGNCTVDLS